MLVDVIAVCRVPMAVVAIVHVVLMDHGLVTTTGRVGVGVPRVGSMHDIITVIVVTLMGMMQVPVVQVVRVLVVDDRGVAAVGRMGVGMLGVGRVRDHG